MVATVNPRFELTVAFCFHMPARRGLFPQCGGAERAVLKGHHRPVWGVAVFPNAEPIASGGVERTFELRTMP